MQPGDDISLRVLLRAFFIDSAGRLGSPVLGTITVMILFSFSLGIHSIPILCSSFRFFFVSGFDVFHNHSPQAVILNPSPPVILSGAKDLGFRLRINSVKDLADWFNTGFFAFAQNDKT